MIRVSTSVTASFWIDGDWRYVTGTRSVPVDRWTHLAITWDRGTKRAGIYVDGWLDVVEVPEGVTDGVLGGGLNMLRLGGHTWQSPAPNLNGLLDEVRVSSVVREYRPLSGAERRPGTSPRLCREDLRKANRAAPRAKFVFPWGMDATQRTCRSRTSKKSPQATQTYNVRAGWNDGRPQLPHADGCRDEFEGASSRLGSPTVGADGEHRAKPTS